MLRTLIAAIMPPASAYAATSHAASALALDPGLITGMLVLIGAQLTVVQLRSKWEQQLVTTRR